MTAEPFNPYGHYIALFMDVMGQKELLKNTPGPLEPECLNRPETQEAYSKTVATITNIASTLEKNFEHFSNRHPIRMQFFSDCMLFYFPVDDVMQSPLQERKFSNIQALLTTAALGQILYLAWGIPLRGGIDLGLGSVNEPVGLYGAVNYSVHHLESKVANYPRIVIGDSLKTYVNSQDPVKVFWFNRLLTERDGACMLDFLGETVSGIISGKKALIPAMNPDTLVGNAYHFVRDRREHYKEQMNSADSAHKKPCEKLYHKYALLYEYVRERKDTYWGRRKRES